VPDLRQLCCFICLREEGSVARAALHRVRAAAGLQVS
jgi:hypothetical protein